MPGTRFSSFGFASLLCLAAAIATTYILVVATGRAGAERQNARRAPAGSASIETGLYVTSVSSLEYARARRAGARLVRLGLAWSQVASARPATREEARDPGYAGYAWADLDRQVRLARANGLEPLITVVFPPPWAADGPPKKPHGPWNVDAAAFADFARAAAARYSGSYGGLPRVRYWMAWNEPNLGTYLNPQFRGGQPYGGVVYRALLNPFADAIHAVRRDNFVIAGGTAPFTAWSPNRKQRWGTSPLAFMRNLLCLSRSLKRSCTARAKFDIWAHHPYTTGGPFHKAFARDDVSLGNLSEMRAVLNAGVREGRILSRGRPRFWVTEFSWDTKPPDPGGVPATLHARWVSEAMYSMWRAGVSAVIWLQLRDLPFPASPFQAGLFYNSGNNPARDRPKPAFQAFRFPFVAYPARRRIDVWGRTAAGVPGRVEIQQRIGSTWRRLTVLLTNRSGIFAGRIASAARGDVRARHLATREVSRAFALRGTKDRRYYPFGSWHP